MAVSLAEKFKTSLKLETDLIEGKNGIFDVELSGKLFYSKIRRWLTNLGFGVTNVVLIDVSLPILGVAASLTAEKIGSQPINPPRPKPPLKKPRKKLPTKKKLSRKYRG